MKTKTKREIIYINKNFWSMLSCLDDRLLVLDYLISHRSGNLAIGTQKNISENTGLTIARTRNFLQTLESKGIIKRHSNGVYELSKAIMPIE